MPLYTFDRGILGHQSSHLFIIKLYLQYQAMVIFHTENNTYSPLGMIDFISHLVGTVFYSINALLIYIPNEIPFWLPPSKSGIGSKAAAFLPFINPADKFSRDLGKETGRGIILVLAEAHPFPGRTEI